MGKKKVRNKFRDGLADYYLTNREITKNYDQEHEKAKQSGKKKSFSNSEKKMIIITGAAIILLILKFLLLS